MTSNGLLAGTGMDRQIALEKRALDLGESKYRDNLHKKIQSGQAGGLPALNHIYEPWIEPTAKCIRRVRSFWFGGSPQTMQHMEFRNVTQYFNSRHLAAISLQVIFNELLRHPEGVTHTSLCHKLWVAVGAELLVLLPNRHDVSVGDAESKISRRLISRWRKATPNRILNSRRIKLISPELWDKVRNKSRKIHCGDGLLHCVFTECLFTTKEGKSVPLIRFGLTEASNGRPYRMAWMDYEVQAECHRSLTHDAALHPLSLPMLIPPLPWGKRRRGGQITNRKPLVVRATKRQRQHQYDAEMPVVYGGINWVATTPFSINRKNLARQEEVWAGGKDFLDIPAELPLDPSQFPKADPDTLRCKEAFKAHKIHLAKLHGANAQRLGIRTQYGSMLTVARMFKDERVYFDQCMDFRGRMYPRSTHLTYAGAKTARSLLLFADAKDPGEEGMRELRIWAANCYGMDKLPYREREQWTLDNMKNIERVSREAPFDDWCNEADSPWEFMAACDALCNPEVAARLPVGRDGTANGLQHLAAMSLDETLAPIVNLTPGDRPGDMYSTVESMVRKALTGDGPICYTTRPKKGVPAKNVAIPRANVLAWVMRATVKQPCMTYAYGVTLDGAVQQVFNAMLDKGAENIPSNFQIAFVIAKEVLAAVAKIAPAPAALMKWMQECARIACKNGKKAGHETLYWTNGIEFLVDQGYRNQKWTAIQTLSGSTTINVDASELAVDVDGQVNGSAPNIIHSFDMEHMLRNSYSMSIENRRYFAQHDQHNTHAADIPRLQFLGRRNFNEMYKGTDRPTMLWEQWKRQYPDKDFPPPPARGTLQLDVSGSDYFTH